MGDFSSRGTPVQNNYFCSGTRARYQRRKKFRFHGMGPVGKVCNSHMVAHELVGWPQNEWRSTSTIFSRSITLTCRASAPFPLHGAWYGSRFFVTFVSTLRYCTVLYCTAQVRSLFCRPLYLTFSYCFLIFSNNFQYFLTIFQ